MFSVQYIWLIFNISVSLSRFCFGKYNTYTYRVRGKKQNSQCHPLSTMWKLTVELDV